MPRTPSRLVVARILDAADTVLDTDGPAGLTAAAVADAAGVSLQTVYNRFGSFEALLDRSATRGFRSLTAALLDLDHRPLGEIDDPLAMLIELWRRYHAFAVARPQLHRFLFDEPQPWRSARAASAESEHVRLVTAVVQRALDAGRLLPGRSEEVTDRLLAAARGAIELEMSRRGRANGGATTGYDAVMATMIRGLRPSAQLR